MNEGTPDAADPAAGDEEAYRLCTDLITLGEWRFAVDCMRRKVNRARRSLPANSLMHLRLLSQYAAILELTEAYGEAEFLRRESIEIAESGLVTAEDAVEAFLNYGLLLVKVRNYSAAVPKLTEAIRRADAIEDFSPLAQQVALAKGWRALQQAYEGLGEFDKASNALDALDDVKRQIRYLIFSMKR
jgi:tetratricopeptide (TPR) repeat protein